MASKKAVVHVVLKPALCGAPRGQKEPTKFARGLSQAKAGPLVFGITLKANIQLPPSLLCFAVCFSESMRSNAFMNWCWRVKNVIDSDLYSS